MIYELTYSDKYIKEFKRLSPTEQKQVTKKLSLLTQNLAHPSLRVKRVKGHDGVWECSVNMDIRVIFRFEGKWLIAALEVGHHDVLKKY